MTDFDKVLGNALIGFYIVAIYMVGLALYHYSYHYQGSKSILLMRRLPDRRELHRRCLSLPAVALLISLLTAFLLLLVYFGIYMICTPNEVLTPGQWQKIWR